MEAVHLVHPNARQVISGSLDRVHQHDGLTVGEGDDDVTLRTDVFEDGLRRCRFHGLQYRSPAAGRNPVERIRDFRPILDVPRGLTDVAFCPC
jgi:hypothetical protein